MIWDVASRDITRVVSMPGDAEGFVVSDDGQLVGYVECDDLTAARAAMAATEVNARWQAEMAPFFDNLSGARPDLGLTVLDEVFNLDAQLNQHNTGESDD